MADAIERSSRRVVWRRSVCSCAEIAWFRGRLAFKARRLLYHSTLGLRVIKKKKKANEIYCTDNEIYSTEDSQV